MTNVSTLLCSDFGEFVAILLEWFNETKYYRQLFVN